jgi:hypothetical protein
MVRAETFTRCVPTCAESGPSSAEVLPRDIPAVASTSSTPGAVVTVALVLARVGCTKRAKVVAFTAAMAEGLVVAATVPESGASEELSTFPLTT